MMHLLNRLVVLSALVGAVLPAYLCAQDAYLQDLSVGAYIPAATDVPITVGIRNAAATPIPLYRIGWRWNKGRAHYSPEQQTSGGGILQNTMMTTTHPVKLKIPKEGPGELQVWVDVPGESDRRNDTLTTVVRAIGRGVEKGVLLEVKTSANCGYCPKGNEVADRLNRDPMVAVAKYHVEDEMATDRTVAYFKKYTSDASTPMGMIDQGEYGQYKASTQYSQWETQVKLRKKGLSPVYIDLEPKFDPRTRELCVEFTATFTYAEPGEYVMNVLLLEDGVAGEQSNTQGGYAHGQVVRQVLGGLEGVSGIIPERPELDKHYSFTFAESLPPGKDPDSMRVIGMVTRREGTKEHTLNVAKSMPLGRYVSRSNTGQ